MLNPTGPFALTLGGAPPQLAPPGSVSTVTAVKLTNASPFAATVATEAGPAGWLQAWSWQLFDLAGADTITVAPQFSTDTSGTVTSGQLTADWYTAGDTLPDPGWGSLTAQAVAAAIAGQVNTAPQQEVLLAGAAFNLGAGGAAAIPFTTPIPAWALSLGFSATITTPVGAASGQFLQVGTAPSNIAPPDVQTGWPWASSGAAFGIAFPEMFTLANPADTDAYVAVNAAVRGTITVVAYAAPAPELRTPGPTLNATLETGAAGLTTILSGRCRLWAAQMSTESGGSSNFLAHLQGPNGDLLTAWTNQNASLEIPGGFPLAPEVGTTNPALQLDLTGTTPAVTSVNVYYSLE